jgi:hypothetical protein
MPDIQCSSEPHTSARPIDLCNYNIGGIQVELEERCSLRRPSLPWGDSSRRWRKNPGAGQFLPSYARMEVKMPYAFRVPPDILEKESRVDRRDSSIYVCELPNLA